jgi:hypothetical protein
MSRCQEHSRLTLAVIHAAQGALDEAKRTNVDLVPPMALLQAAQSEQRHAAAALGDGNAMLVPPAHLDLRERAD